MILNRFFDILYVVNFFPRGSASVWHLLNDREREANMISRDIVINNASGLHARPATFFIQKANSYPCSIWIEKDDRKVNAKSLLGVLSMGIARGMSVTLVADGQGEEEALAGLIALIESGFEEA